MASTRNPRTAASSLWLTSSTIDPARARKTGPYGEVVWYQRASMSAVYGLAPWPSTVGQ